MAQPRLALPYGTSNGTIIAAIAGGVVLVTLLHYLMSAVQALEAYALAQQVVVRAEKQPCSRPDHAARG